jgi:hypothetical protein
MRNQQPKMSGWFAAGFRLSVAFPYHPWREAPWLREVITDSDEPGRVRAFELVEAPHTQRIEIAVEQWLGGVEPPTLAHPASYLLALRFSTVGHLLMSFDGLFPPPPESSVPAIYRKFLLDWWRKNGPIYGVGYSSSEHDHEG